MSVPQETVPNHHAQLPGFSGLTGILAAATMVLGRQGDARLAEELSGLGPDDTVVDVGCGPGAAVRRAAGRASTVTGVDPSPTMLRVARLLSQPLQNARFVEGTAEALPVPSDSVSVLWSIASVHHWADLDAGLGEALRTLKPGGRLVAIERRVRTGARGHASHGWTDDQASTFADRCVEKGFANARVGRHAHGRRRTVSVTCLVPGGSEPDI
ncbi:MAG: class I SAM-dependent methyltransferase [Acidimicrobiales bacterium]|nr:class I SAM-dependent methyltransferase [Acidimicrobiales bacterium]